MSLFRRTSSMIFLPEIRIAVIGMSKSGKSSLINQIIMDKFDEKVLPTLKINSSMIRGLVNLGRKSESVKIIIDDFAGSDTVPPECLDYDAFIVVYANDDSKSFNIATKMIKTIFHYKKWNHKIIFNEGRPIYPCFLIQTKNDLNTVNGFIYASFCKEYNLHHYSSSAKSGQIIPNIFNNLSQIAMKNIRHIKYICKPI